eukprot:TRINITY_DN31863_c0_g1_i3.p1 TRINITY_DN31863_c0_g1~~TRINITY_DN31863_c0_g1_i3.p1  ORF type:complete len:254 (+),score=35.68 TRINITY_DN31863_c0_g1_i3:86-847(+)
MELQDQIQPLSESYPPNSKSNCSYFASIHQILKECDIKFINKNDISVRHYVQAEDIEQLKLLHKEWFPINYDNAFFNSLLAGAVYSVIVELYIPKYNKKFIVGFASYNYKEVNHKYQRLFLRNLLAEEMSVYILTIGVINEFRKFGIGTQIINELKIIAQNNKNIKYIYLHMVTYNKAGTKFYQKNGFQVLEEKVGYYNIENQLYNAYVFCCYINKGEKPRTWREIFHSYQTCLKILVGTILLTIVAFKLFKF